MNNWFECKVRYQKMYEDGTPRITTETYLVEAENFAEAETRIIEEMTYVGTEIEATAVKKDSIAEVSHVLGYESFYRCKVMFITLDEKSGREKKTPHIIMVGADDFQEAVKNLAEAMKDTMSDWEIHSVQATNILMVFEMNQYPNGL